MNRFISIIALLLTSSHINASHYDNQILSSQKYQNEDMRKLEVSSPTSSPQEEKRKKIYPSQRLKNEYLMLRPQGMLRVFGNVNGPRSNVQTIHNNFVNTQSQRLMQNGYEREIRRLIPEDNIVQTNKEVTQTEEENKKTLNEYSE